MAVASDLLQHQLKAMGIDACGDRPVRTRGVGLFSLCALARPGDHVAIKRRESGEWQHAIFLGSVNGDLTVLQQCPSATIHLTPFDLFMGDHRTLYQSIIILYDSPATDASRYTTLCRAFVAADMGQLPFNTDSASFAIWCITGSCEPGQSASLNKSLLAAPEPVRYASKRAEFSWSQLV
jgi:hypothetical protein